MRPIYRAGCDLKQDSTLSDFSEAVSLCYHWVIDREQVRSPSGVSDPTASWAHQEIGDGFYAEAMRVDEEDSQGWGILFEHPDATDDRLVWRTELAVQRAPNERLCFSCSTLVGNRDGTLSPVRRAPGRPRIVETLLKKWPSDDPRYLSVEPRILTQSGRDISAFLDLLYHAERRHPILFVSAKNIDDRPVIDPRPIASALSGLAYTFVASDRFPSLALKDRLPERLNCWDGAIRIYWPGFRSTDPPLRHRLWTNRLVSEIERQLNGRGFRGFILERVAGFSSFNVHDDFLTWDTLLSRNRRQLLARAANQGDYEQLATDYAADNDVLRQQVQQLRQQLKQHSQDLEQSRNETESWRQAYEAERRGQQAGDELDLPVTNVAEAIQRATVDFPDALVFALNNRSDANTPFEAPDEVYSALTFLATTYRDARRGARPCPDIDNALRTEIDAWTYRGGQSEITMTTYRGWYQCSDQGKTYWLGEHVGTGSSKDARFTIRIAFAWDDDRKKVVVGFIGQHQKDDNT